MTAPGSRRGFSLVEVMVSMTLLAIAMSSFAGPTYQYARRALALGTETTRNAIVAQQVNRLSALPFDSLASRAGCTTVAASPVPHTRCVTLAAVSAVQTRVSLVITPTSSALRPDTAVFDRTRPATGNPFSTP